MKLDINPEEVTMMETKKLWNIIQIVKNDEHNNMEKEEFDKIRNGIKLKCPIWYMTEEWYELHPSSKKVTIKGYGKYKMEDFMTEKEGRDGLMREIILDNIGEEGIIESRV